MKYGVSLTDRAERDLDELFHWLSERSPSGAVRWYDEFLKLLKRL